MTKQQLRVLAVKLGLSEQQVYKWSWDQERRNEQEKKGKMRYHYEAKLKDDGEGHEVGLDDDETIEDISRLLDIDVEDRAYEIIQGDSPTNFRIV